MVEAIESLEDLDLGTSRYEVLADLGEGSMGRVYRVHDRETGTQVALKRLHASMRDANAIRALKSEFRSLADVVHRNLAQLYELEVNDRARFFTMELVRGVDFHRFLRSNDGVDFDRVRQVARGLAGGIAALHATGRLHRDIKPTNVLVEPDGRAVLLDFGLSKALRDLSGAGDSDSGLSGTPEYMAPEQLWGQPTEASADWYALGSLLYEALTGELPFPLEGDDSLYGARERPPRPPDAPRELSELVLSLLANEPGERPGAARILAALGSRPTASAFRTEAAGESDATRPQDGDPSSFVGRDAERAEIAGRLARSRNGIVALLVSGPSGIGKSTLVERTLDELRIREDVRVLHARCRAQESVPYRAVDGIVDALSSLLERESPQLLGVLPAAERDALQRVFPVLARDPDAIRARADDALAPQRLRRSAFRGLRRLLLLVAERAPLVLWIDDLQWGDLDSAPLLRTLLTAHSGPGFLLVATCRSEEQERSPLLHELRGGERRPETPIEWLELGPLPARELRKLASHVLGTDADEEHLDTIAREAQGSPFFAAELARSLAERGASNAPADLAEVVKSRIARLSSVARALLDIVSVAGTALDRGLALELAGVGEAGRPVVSALAHGGLLRLVPGQTRPQVEAYHDRIAEAVVALLPHARLRATHAALATTLESQPGSDPELLMRHFHGSEDLGRAAHYATMAADRAVGALAFAHAADLYGRALAWGSQAAGTRRQLRAKQAGALVNAGRCAEAAPLYLEAAEGAERERSLELRRLAAEQLLVSGRIDEGVNLLEPLVAELGLTLPATAPRAVAATLRALARLRLRGLRAKHGAPGVHIPGPSPRSFDPEARLKIELGYSIARGLSAVDTARAAALPCAALLLALDHGDLLQIGRSLSAVGSAVLAPLPGRLGRWGLAMLEEARAIAEETGDPYLLASTGVAAAQVHVIRGHWVAAVAEAERAIQILDGQVHGATWERHSGHMALLRGLEEQGRLREQGTLARAVENEAVEVGDHYGRLTASLSAAVVDIAEGRTSEARRRAKHASELWSPHGFTVQHFYGKRIDVLADVYDGAVDSAWETLEALASRMRASGLMMVPITRIDYRVLRGRVALACAVRHRDDALLRVARTEAARLAREGRDDASAHARLLEAGIACEAAQAGRAAELCGEAERLYANVQMPIMAGLAAHRRVALMGDGAELRRIESRLTSAGVTEPERWIRLHAPGT